MPARRGKSKITPELEKIVVVRYLEESRTMTSIANALNITVKAVSLIIRKHGKGKLKRRRNDVGRTF